MAVAPQFQRGPEPATPLEGPVEVTVAAEPTPDVALPSLVADGPVKVYFPAVVQWHDTSYVSPMGISMYGPVGPESGLQQMKDAGAKWVITYLRWADIQPTDGGPYNWTVTDAKFANATAAGLKIHAVFDINPEWAAAEERGPIYQNKLAAFDAMVAAMASRYNGSGGRPQVDYWSFYGEPDNNVAWGNHGAQYAALIARAAPIIRARNSNASIILSGLAYDKFTDDEVNPPGRFVRRFITDTLQALNTNHGGAAQYLDQVAFNYYPISLPRWPTLREKALEIRSIMVNHGIGHLPMMVTEMSMWSVWPPELGGENQAQQAHYLVHFYVRGLSVGVEQLYWFQVFDVLPAYSGSAQGLFVGTDLGQPKQSYWAYKVLAQELSNARFSHVLNAPGAEGYVFRRGPDLVTVVWGAGASPVQVDFVQSCARRVSVTGTASQITDGGAGDLDGSANGRVRLQVVFEQPMYVTRCQ